MAVLGVTGPDIQPRATEYIPKMIELIDMLIERSHAYAAEGHVLFNLPSFKNYGALSRRNREDQIAGARVEDKGFALAPSTKVRPAPLVSAV